VAELRAGKTLTKVAEDYHTTPSTVYKTKRRWDTYHNNGSRPRKGHPKKLTAIQIIRINSYINRHRHLTWNDSHWRRKWRSKKRILLSEENAKERLQFAQYWIPRVSELLLSCFSRECTIQNAPNDPDGWVFRRLDEKFCKDLVNCQSHGK
ncbi:hypothetical protein B0J13DRAFT_410137, partial [Dactylonectria estremocensis]